MVNLSYPVHQQEIWQPGCRDTQNKSLQKCCCGSSHGQVHFRVLFLRQSTRKSPSSLEVSQKGGFIKGQFWRMCLSPLRGIKVHPPYAFALLRARLHATDVPSPPFQEYKHIFQNPPFGNHPFNLLHHSNLVSRGRCGRKIARLRLLAAVVAASFLRF